MLTDTPHEMARGVVSVVEVVQTAGGIVTVGAVIDGVCIAGAGVGRPDGSGTVETVTVLPPAPPDDELADEIALGPTVPLADAPSPDVLVCAA